MPRVNATKSKQAATGLNPLKAGNPLEPIYVGTAGPTGVGTPGQRVVLLFEDQWDIIRAHCENTGFNHPFLQQLVMQRIQTPQKAMAATAGT